MYYKYKKYIELSPNGTSLDIRGSESIQPVLLGEIDGWNYAYLEEEIEQDERLQATEVELTSEEKATLKSQLFGKSRKEFVRMKLDDVGDIQDFIADAMKLIEFNMMLTARLAGDIWGTNPIADEKKAAFSARNKLFLDSVDAGVVTLRSDFDDIDLVMTRLLERVSKTNQIVKDSYIAELKKVGL